MNQLQNILVDELEYIINFCEKNNIVYYVIGGTLLGSVRHHGFIPWDNDIDFGVPRKDYERLIELLKIENGRYHIETSYSEAPEFLYKFSKLYDTTTTVIEDTKRPCKRGVFIDIIPLDGIGNSWLQAKMNFLPIYLLNTLLTADVISVRQDRPFWLNFLAWVMGKIPEGLINEKKLLIKLDNMCKKRDFDSNKYVGVLNGGYGLRDIVEHRIFEERADYQFERLTVKSVKEADEYLTHLYGNWRKLPDENRRKSDHDFDFVDLNHSYLD